MRGFTIKEIKNKSANPLKLNILSLHQSYSYGVLEDIVDLSLDNLDINLLNLSDIPKLMYIERRRIFPFHIIMKSDITRAWTRRNIIINNRRK